MALSCSKVKRGTKLSSRFRGISELQKAKHMLRPREEWDKRSDPQRIGLHNTYYHYIDNPPVFTYKTLKKIISIIKIVGLKITGKQIRVGATFDPGPEFAKSEFKFVKHEEICTGNTMGAQFP